MVFGAKLLGHNGRRALSNMVVKALSVPVEKACRLLLIIVAAPILGEAAFGRFQFADTVTALLVLATDLGLGIWMTRALARTPGRADTIVGTGLWVRSHAGVPYLVLVAAAALVVGPGETRTALVLLGVASLAGAFVEYCNAVFRGYERLRDEARLNVVRAVLVTGAGLVGLCGRRTLVALAGGVAVGAVAAAVYGVSILRGRYGLTTLLQRGTFDPKLARSAVREALPLWMATLLSLVYFKGDAVLLRLLVGDAAVGSYAAAYKIFEATMILPSIILAASFPGLVRAADDPRGRRRSELGLGGVLVGLGVVVGGAICVGSARIIGLVFGAGFANSARSLQVLGLAVPLLFLNFGLTHFLIARNLERRNLVFAIVMVVLNLGMNLWLIPRSGAVGAAWATLGTEVALTICCLLTLASGPALAAVPRPAAPSAASRARTLG
jgi:O-antigen/teichoic acid export membrane protein